MKNTFLIFMMVACMHSAIIHSMQKNKEKKVIRSNSNHILSHAELTFAKEKFGSLGMDVAQTLLLRDKDKVTKQKKSLQGFKDIIDDKDYPSFSTLAQRYVDTDIKMLRFIFSDVAYKEYAHNITELCKSVITACKKKENYVEEAQKFFEQTINELSVWAKNRENDKQVLLENYVFNHIIDKQKELILSLFEIDFVVEKYNLRKMIDIQFACIQQMELFMHKKKAQEFFSNFCYQLSISAWAKNHTTSALEYGIVAYKTAIDWDLGSHTTRTSLNNWLEMLGGAKYEEPVIKSKPTIGKRKFPIVRAVEKKQKMFIQ